VILERSCGVLLHPTSLPGAYGIGDFGPEARRYLRWLADAGVRWWQVLPLQVAGPENSPYSARSTFAGNRLLISPDLLAQEGLLAEEDLADLPFFSKQRVDYERAIPFKRALLRRAWLRFNRSPPADLAGELAELRKRSPWLADYALYAALREAHFGAPWYEWPAELALRRPSALSAWQAEHMEEVEQQEFCQFLFAHQWGSLRDHAHGLGLRILGDMPLFMAYDSAEVWAHRELFLLDERGRPTVVAGVPPDYFSTLGQLWGNPLYDWKALERTGYAWWIDRLRHLLELVDLVRLDHFRGFMAHWEIPAAESTAIHGRWRPGPGHKLFDAIRARLGGLPLVAEDLGDISDDVVALREWLDLPGMAVLQFAFAPAPRSEFLPYNHERNQVVYTGTHDNNTTVGWYRDDASTAEKDFARRYLATDGSEIHWDMIRLALSSVANLAVIPHQDIAGIGSEGRMNQPGLASGNWRFRLTDAMLAPAHQRRLAELIWTYGRRGLPETSDYT
jgi:4-alpha-glucanotransferase